MAMQHGADRDISIDYAIGVNKNVAQVDAGVVKIGAVRQQGNVQSAIKIGTELNAGVGGISALIGGMEALNISSGGARDILVIVATSTMAILGGLKLYSLIRSAIMAEALVEGSAAAVETTAAAASGVGLVNISIATIAAAAVAAGFASGFAIGSAVREQSTHTEDVDINEPGGQRRIEDVLRQQRREAEVYG